MTSIRLRSVSKSFRRRGETPVGVLQDISLDIASGCFLAVLGPSGCGKTTLLRLLAGLLPPDAGDIAIGGRPPRPGPEVGFIFQSFRLVPWLTVRENVGFGLVINRMPAAERRARTDRYLDAVGLSRFADAYPSALSGGMKQRAAMARALASEPSLLLLDEPFASLDAQTREFMQMELMRLWSAQRATAVFVTHSVDEALLLADRIVLMSTRPGRILESIEITRLHARRFSDVRADPTLVATRAHLSARIRELVSTDPASDFYGRPVRDASDPAP